jgi:hypothetical protein
METVIKMKKTTVRNMFYSLDEVTSLLSQLMAGQDVDDKEIDKALDKAQITLKAAVLEQKEFDWLDQKELKITGE